MAEILCVAPRIGAEQVHNPAGLTQGVPGFMAGEPSFDFSKNESYCSADRLNIVTGGRALPVSHADVTSQRQIGLRALSTGVDAGSAKESASQQRLEPCPIAT